MVIFSCHCLNVEIFGEKSDKSSHSEALENCPLSPSCELIELLEQGYKFRHKCLVQRMKDGDWTVYMCTPCHMRTHAVNYNLRLVVVNALMEQTQEEAIKSLKNHPDFSTVYNLVLSAADGKPKDDGAPYQNYESLQKQLGELQLVLSKYLKQEEEAMERRIRAFEEEQRNKFTKLKEHAQKEKTKLISILFHNSEGSQQSSSHDKKGHSPLIHSKSTVESGESGSEDTKMSHYNLRVRSPDLFEMDEVTFGEQIEHIKTDLDINNERYLRTLMEIRDENNYKNDNAPKMSTSVPINMPENARFLRNIYLDEDIEETSEFADIPKNMQALSESIQERDRYIFGDRPRQRVHTGDFTQVNWH